MRPLIALAMLLIAARVSAAPCEPEVRGLEPFFSSGSTILVGEIHGTVEIPRLLWSIACTFASSGAPAVVGMEISSTEQPRIDAFLESDGSPEDRRRLLVGPFWNAEFPDGRSSEAVFDLLERLRKARKQHLPVRFVAVQRFDPGGDRDRAMADGIEAARRVEPDAALIVSLGNNHTRVDSGQSAGGILRGRGVTFFSLNVAHGKGTFWGCTDGCKVHEVEEGNGVAKGPWRIYRVPDRRHVWDGEVVIGPITASPPATQAQRRGR